MLATRRRTLLYPKVGFSPFIYSPGDTKPGETFTRSTVGLYVDNSGVVQSAAINTKRDAHYISGVRHLLYEGPATNVVLWNRDLTNAAWTHTTMTATKDQTGADGVANSATRLTATAANATSLQAITLASSYRSQTAYVKRITGTGTVQMTTDNGTTWVAITVTTSWARQYIRQQLVTNPTVGFRLVTSGDEIAVDYVQNEVGPNSSASWIELFSSPIATTTVAVTRGGELYSFAWPKTAKSMSVYIDHTNIGAIGGSIGNVDYFNIGRAAGSPIVGLFLVLQVGKNPPDTRVVPNSGATWETYSPASNCTYVYGDEVEHLGTVGPDGRTRTTVSVNRTTEYRSWELSPSVGASPIVPVGGMSGDWSGPGAQGVMVFGSSWQSGANTPLAIRGFKVFPGVRVLADMRSG